MSKTEVEGWKKTLRKLAPRMMRATFWSLIIGIVFLLAEYLLASFLFSFYPDSQNLFNIFAWTIIIFTFLIKFSEGTIYKYAFMVGRAFFLIIYFIYATNGGILNVEAMGFHVELEFVPLMVLLVSGSLIAMVRHLVQTINFLTETSV